VTAPLRKLETPTGVAALRWLIGIVFTLGLLGCVTKGADNPPDPYLASVGSTASESPTRTAARIPLAGFGETKLKVQVADRMLEWCLLLAATDAQRARGLMQVTDPTLGGYDGMLFRYDADADEGYWMRNTPMPLSIVFVHADGSIVSTADMEPCADSPNCRNYPPAGPYRLAIEVPQGRLPSLGIVAGSTITDEQTTCS
jgi:uncharacterized membrane protein (UPF0127 family)